MFSKPTALPVVDWTDDQPTRMPRSRQVRGQFKCKPPKDCSTLGVLTALSDHALERWREPLSAGREITRIRKYLVRMRSNLGSEPIYKWLALG